MEARASSREGGEVGAALVPFGYPIAGDVGSGRRKIPIRGHANEVAGEPQRCTPEAVTPRARETLNSLTCEHKPTSKTSGHGANRLGGRGGSETREGLRELNTLSGDPGSISSTNMEAHNTCNSQ